MKRLVLAMAGSVIFLCGSDVSAQAEGDFSVAERGAHHRVWERVTAVTNVSGRVESSTNSYTELEAGMHFLRAGQWVESRAQGRRI